MEEKKVPRIVRNINITQRRTHFDEKILMCPKHVAEERLEICKSCPALKDWGCEASGFFMPTVVRQRSQGCPYGKWSSYYEIEEKK